MKVRLLRFDIVTSAQLNFAAPLANKFRDFSGIRALKHSYLSKNIT